MEGSAGSFFGTAANVIAECVTDVLTTSWGLLVMSGVINY